VWRAILQVSASIALADLSWRFVETPIRRGALGRLWAEAKTSALRASRARTRFLAIASVLALALLVGGLIGDVAHSTENAAASTVPVAKSRIVQSISPQTMAAHPAHGTAHATSATSLHSRSSSRPAKAPLTSDSRQGKDRTHSHTKALGDTKKPSRRPPTSKISAAEQAHRWEAALGRTTTSIGDSIMIDMQPYLPQFLPGIWVDGDVGRQMISLPAAVAQLKADGKLRSRLIIELGTNGPFDEGQLVTFLRSLHVKEIILANTRVPRPWQNEVNAMLAQVASVVPHTTLVNWYQASANHNDYFYPDGVHLNPLGARVYAALLAHALEAHAKAT